MQPGDCVIINAANSTVGQTLCQLCQLLKLRAVAVARDIKAVTSDDGGASSWDRMVTLLKSVGATEVLKDEGSLKVGRPHSPFTCLPVHLSHEHGHVPRSSWTSSSSSQSQNWLWMRWAATPA